MFILEQVVVVAMSGRNNLKTALYTNVCLELRTGKVAIVTTSGKNI